MYCPKCGNEIDGYVQTCPVCGYSELTPEKAIHLPSDDAPLFTLKPTFNGSVAVLWSLQSLMFYVVFLWAFIGALILGGFISAHVDVPWWSAFVISLVISLLLVIIGGFNYKSSKYANLEYRFYRHHAEIIKGSDTNTLEYVKTNVAKLYYGSWRRNHGLGTILLRDEIRITHFGAYRAYRTDFWIEDIENPEENYEKIKALIAKAQAPTTSTTPP